MHESVLQMRHLGSAVQECSRERLVDLGFLRHLLAVLGSLSIASGSGDGLGFRLVEET